jgi:pyrroline-5-carboxylate reductase
MTRETICFIGGGNMAASLVAGLVADGHEPRGLLVSDPDRAKLDNLAARFGVRTTDDNTQAVRDAAVVLLCVKPQMARAVCQTVAPVLAHPAPLIISVMAGIRELSIQAWLGGGVPVVRAMPNTPAMIQAGAIVLHASPEVTDSQRNQAETILRAGGLTQWVEREELMDVVTALSGSGPAYFFFVMEILEQTGVELGLDPDSARLLTIQTALGAARMAMESSDTPQTLRQRVTSPGGTTESALRTLEEGSFRDLLARAVRTAKARSEELSRLLAEES